MNPSVAIAVLNYNGKHYLERFIPFVMASSYLNKTIWVIDNASQDGSIEFLESRYPQIRIIKNSRNVGFAEGYNSGLAYIQADYYVLLNNDVEVTPGFIEPVVKLMEENKNIAFAQPKLLNIFKRDTFEYAGAAGGMLDTIGYPFCRGRMLETLEKDTGQYDGNESIFWATGACMFARASVYKELNGMYAFLYMQNEDIDLCWRAQNKGYKIFSCGSSVVYHTGGGSLGWNHPKKIFFTFRNNLVIITRNMPVTRLVWVIPLRMLIDSMAACHYILNGKWKQGFKVLHGMAAYWKWVFEQSINKWPVSKGFSNCDGTINKILVWQYFIRRRKTAGELAD